MKKRDSTKSKKKFVIAQKPNLPLIVWFVTLIISKLPLHITLVRIFEIISFGAIFTWAWLEIFFGVNYFRRILGGVVMIIIIYTRL